MKALYLNHEFKRKTSKTRNEKIMRKHANYQRVIQLRHFIFEAREIVNYASYQMNLFILIILAFYCFSFISQIPIQNIY
jgi:hypothetical protein